MIINSVKLHNIRSYLDEEIRFPEGSVLLSGDIGSGKSTILLAVEFALFGILQGVLEGEALLRNGKNNGYAELDFNADGKRIIIRRNLKRNRESVRQDSGYLIINDMKLDLTPSELKARVLEILGYPKELLTKSKALIYRYTVYTHQEAMKHILFENPEMRLDVFRRVFQIDKYRRIGNNCSILLQSVNERKKVLNAQISDLEQMKEKKSGLENSLKEKRINIAAFSPVVEDCEKKIKERQKGILEAEQRIRELNEIKVRISSITAAAEEKRKQLLSINTELRKTGEDISGYERKYESSKGNIPVFLARVAALQSYLVNEKFDKSRKSEIKEEMLNLEEVLTELTSTITESQLIMDNSEKIKNKIAELDKCPLCMQPVTEEHKSSIHESENKKMKDAAKILDKNAAIRQETEAKLRNIRQELEKISENEGRFERLRFSSEAFMNSVNELNLEPELEKYVEIREAVKFEESEIPILANLQKQLRDSNYALNILEEKRNLRNALMEKQSASRKEIMEAEAMLNLQKEKLRSFGDIEISYHKIRNEVDELMRKLREAAAKKAAFEKEEEYIMRNISEVEQEISKKIRMKEELAVLMQLHNWLQEYFLNLMNVIEKHVMLKIHQEFNELFQNWFSILMESEVLSARLDEEFSPVIMQDGYETAVENLSGGEKTSCALAYRLALNKVINDMISGIKTKDIIILDEPTDGFSSEQLEKVRDVIRQLNVKQIIIVSHEAKVESFVDNVIRIVKNEHVSRVEA